MELGVSTSSIYTEIYDRFINGIYLFKVDVCIETQT